MIIDSDALRSNGTLQAEDVDPKDVLKILEKHGEDSSALVSILGEIQAKYRYLPEDALRIVADTTGCSLVDVYGAATFYRSFSLKPKGKHVISVCMGTACHVRGAPGVADEFEHQLGISPGETTSDKQFTFETVNCLGACALGPVVVIDGHYFSKVGKARVRQLIDDALKGLDKVEIGENKGIFPIEVSCPHCNHSLMEAHDLDGYPSIRATASFEDKHGWIRWSSLYGSCIAQCEHEIPSDTVVSLFCPHCHGKLVGSARCLDCEAPMAWMVVRNSGTLLVCLRCGCDGHMLDLGDGDPTAGDGTSAEPTRGISRNG